MATAFVTIAQAAVTAPLNHAYRLDEYKFYLDDLKAKALVVMAGNNGTAVEAAQNCDMTVLRLHVAADDPAGNFALVPDGTTDGPAPQSKPGAVPDPSHRALASISPAGWFRSRGARRSRIGAGWG